MEDAAGGRRMEDGGCSRRKEDGGCRREDGEWKVVFPVNSTCLRRKSNKMASPAQR